MEVLNFLLFLAALVVPMLFAWLIVGGSDTKRQRKHERKSTK
jgi:hypothetical protein